VLLLLAVADWRTAWTVVGLLFFSVFFSSDLFSSVSVFSVFLLLPASVCCFSFLLLFLMVAAVVGVVMVVLLCGGGQCLLLFFPSVQRCPLLLLQGCCSRGRKMVRG
jgi:hypothetical protein